MLDAAGLRDEQRQVARAMAAAVVVTIAVLAGAAIVGRQDEVEPVARRLAVLGRAELFVVAWLVAAVANVARLRFFSAEDIAGSSHGAGSPKLRDASAVLQNTLQQVVLAVAAHAILTTTGWYSPALLAALAGLFGIGRLLFSTGYSRGAAGRAFGFALTFYPSAACLVIAAASIVLD